MPLDSYVTLGRSGLRVSPLCLGAMTFGEDTGWGASVEVSETLLDEYLERGGNFIDTANIYTNGHSEKILGDYLARHQGRRDRLVIGTKFFGNLHAGDPNGGGAGRKGMVAQCEESLRRLQTDYIDIYWLHNWDPVVPIEETLRALDDLVTSGKIRYVGFSDLPGWKVAQAQTIAQFRGWSPAITLQLEYSLLERTSEGELFPAAQELGLGVMPWGPLKSGFLSGKYSRKNNGEVLSGRSALGGGPSDADYTIIEALQGVATEVGAKPAAVALAWVLQRPGVTSTLVGARDLEQLRTNLDCLDLDLPLEQLAVLDEVSAPRLNFPADFNRTVAPAMAFAGATVDGQPSFAYPMLTENPEGY